MITNVTVQQAQELLSRGELDLVDVRDNQEWSTGHLPGARHVPLERLRTNPASVLPRDGVLFVCAAGMRSQTAAKLAAAQGLTKLYSLRDGTKGWARAGLPLVRD